MTVVINGTTGYSGPVGTIGDLTTTGNTTLGDASGDTLTINGNTASIPNDLNLTGGNLGIGESSPVEKLQVNGGVAVTGAFNGASNGGAVNITYSSGTGSIYALDPSVAWKNLDLGSAQTTFSISGAEKMRLDSSGNLGLGVTPSAWSDGKAIQVGTQLASLWGIGTSTILNSNTFYSSGDKYVANGAAAQFEMNSGAFNFYTAPSGTAGNAISFTQAMTLNASGDLGLGTTTLTNSTGYSTLSLSGSTGGQLAFQTAGVGKQYIYSTSTDLNFYNSVAGNLTFSTNSTERARIDSSGNLLVGTTGAVGKLTVYKAGSSYVDSVVLSNDSAYGANQGIAWGSSANISGRIKGIDDGAFGTNITFETRTGGPSTSTTERARIDSSGHLIVNSTSDLGQSAFIQAYGYDNKPAHFKLESTVSGYCAVVLQRNNSGNLTENYNGSTFCGGVGVSGSNSYYATSSDYRLKNTIAPMTGALAKVALLKPCTYKWNADGSDGEGFIAHELAEVVPQAVTGEKDAVDADGKPVYQGIDTSFLVATLTAAIQEQQAIIETLKARLDAANL